jgi:hypothetical protein
VVPYRENSVVADVRAEALSGYFVVEREPVVEPRGTTYDGLDGAVDGAGLRGPAGSPRLGAAPVPGVGVGMNGAGAENTRPPEASAARSSYSVASAVPSAGRGR